MQFSINLQRIKNVKIHIKDTAMMMTRKERRTGAKCHSTKGECLHNFHSLTVCASFKHTSPILLINATECLNFIRRPLSVENN